MGSIGGNVVLAISIAVGILIAMALQRRKNLVIAARLEPLLRDRGPQTLPELAGALGMGGFFSRGKVVLALNDMVAAQRVEVIEAPLGTPQLEKVNHIRYRLRG